MTLHELIRQDRTSVIEEKADIRKTIEQQIEEFFAAGNEITEVETTWKN